MTFKVGGPGRQSDTRGRASEERYTFQRATGAMGGGTPGAGSVRGGIPEQEEFLGGQAEPREQGAAEGEGENQKRPSWRRGKAGRH